MKGTFLAHVWYLGRSRNLLSPYRKSISSKLCIFVDVHLEMWNTHAPQFLLTVINYAEWDDVWAGWTVLVDSDFTPGHSHTCF